MERFAFGLLIALIPASASAAAPVAIDWSVDGPLMLAGTGLWGGLILGANRQPFEWRAPYAAPGGIDALAHTHYEKPFGTASDLTLVTLIGGGLAANLVDGLGTQQPVDRVALYWEALMFTGDLTELTKWAVRRPRPFTLDAAYDPTNGKPDDTLSFFSGHTSWAAAISFTTAREIDLAHDLSPGARIGLYGGAGALTAAMGVMRVAAGKHYPSDVIVGACVGAGVGLLIPNLHRSKLTPATATLDDGATTIGLSIPI